MIDYTLDLGLPQLDISDPGNSSQGKRIQHQAAYRVNGDANKISFEDLPVHDWYRFVLSYPPHLVRDYIKRFALDGRYTVLDPFCGTGTTLVECKKLGIPSIGIEVNPMAHFASEAKVNWGIDPDSLMDHALQIAEAASSELRSNGIADESLLFVRENSQHPM